MRAPGRVWATHYGKESKQLFSYRRDTSGVSGGYDIGARRGCGLDSGKCGSGCIRDNGRDQGTARDIE